MDPLQFIPLKVHIRRRRKKKKKGERRERGRQQDEEEAAGTIYTEIYVGEKIRNV